MNREMNNMFWKHASLRTWLPIFLSLVVCGCSTVQTTKLPPGELQDQIATGQLVKPGDQVIVTTTQGITYELEITRVTEESIKGREYLLLNHQEIDENADTSMRTVPGSLIEIPVAEIRTIGTREVTPVGKAAAATGAAVAVGGIMYFMYFLLPTLVVSAAVGL